MNNARRKEIEEIKQKFDSLGERLTDVLQDVQSIEDDEQDAYDNMPEGLQGSERGEMSQTAISSLGDARSKIEEIIQLAADVAGDLEGAAE